MIRRLPPVAFCALVLLGCRRSGADAPPLTPEARTAVASSSVASGPRLDATRALATSSADTPLSSKWHIVVVSKSAISIDAGPPIVTLPFGETRNGFYIAPLGDVLRAIDHGHELAFAFDPATPYQLVTETLYTAAMTEITSFHLAVRRNGASTEFVSQPSSAANAQDASLGLFVLVGDAGTSIRVRGAYVGPGCELPRPNAVELSRKGVFDVEGLAACAAKLRARYPESDPRVVLGAGPSIPWQSIVRVADALRASADGTPLFPKVEWGVPR
ncbi:hypothetical protein LVJ94_27970 [Pendulispora rubella]|uniref:Uncharacterized protein n=1 Tax=Pendulispora rubella TaxID=2741070 RepID=A0ABZ2KUV5_9BACT